MATTLDRIKELMNSNGISAYKLTKELGFSNSTFTDWNKGKGSPSVDALAKIASYFSVSLDYLVFGTDEDGKDEAGGEQTVLSEDDVLLSKYHKLPAEYQGKVMAYIDGMLAVIEGDEVREDALSG